MKTDLSANTSRTELEHELKKAGVEFKGKTCKCPFHEDKHASAGIYEEGGVWRFKCHVPTCGFGGDVFDVRAKLSGKPLAEVIKAESPNQVEQALNTGRRLFASVDEIRKSVTHLGAVEDIYTYTDPKTQRVDVAQVRYIPHDEERKKFLVHRAAPGGFVLGAPEKPWPIYNRGRVAQSKTIVIVEGEKCVHALHRIGIVATCSLSGASNAKHADWSPLAGKTVYIWPDNDDSGLKYANDVAEMLDHVEPRPSIRMLTVPSIGGLEKGGDVADLIEQGWGAEDVWTILNGAELIGSGADLRRRLNDLTSGKWSSIEWKWRHVSMAKSMFPGCITLLCGDPGTSKSFMLLEAMYWWHENGHKVALFELEDDRAFHLHRLLAILSRRWDLLDDEWCRRNKEELEAHYADFEEQLNNFSRCIFSAQLGNLRYAELIEWIEKQCEAGAKILGVDPVTAVSTNESRHGDDLSFIVKASSILIKYGARLILITHPRSASPRGGKTMDDLAGGRAFSRNTQTVLWLHRHEPAKNFICRTPHGNFSAKCNRSLSICKSRNGLGMGRRIAFIQGPEVQFAEQGIVTGENDDE